MCPGSCEQERGFKRKIQKEKEYSKRRGQKKKKRKNEKN